MRRRRNTIQLGGQREDLPASLLWRRAVAMRLLLRVATAKQLEKRYIMLIKVNSITRSTMGRSCGYDYCMNVKAV